MIHWIIGNVSEMGVESLIFREKGNFGWDPAE